MTCGVWAPRGSRPVRQRQAEFGATYVFGAFFPRTGHKVGLLLPHCNTAAMSQFLGEVSGSLSPEDHAVLVLDNAGWHHSKSLVVPANVSLLHQPKYSPEVNGAENVWGFMKRKYLAHQVFADHESMLDAGQIAFNSLTSERVSSLSGRKWAEFGD